MGDNIATTMYLLCSEGTAMRALSRQQSVVQLGSTIEPSHHPKFKHPVTGNLKMLPIPVVSSCPGSIGDCILCNIWLKELVSGLSSIKINHLTSTNPPGSK